MIVNGKKDLEGIEKEETSLKSSRIEVDQKIELCDNTIKANQKKVSLFAKYSDHLHTLVID